MYVSLCVECHDRGLHTRGSVVGDRIGENFSQVKEDTAAFVEDLDSGLDLEVFAHGDVERVESGFAFPEKVGDVEHIGCCMKIRKLSSLMV